MPIFAAQAQTITLTDGVGTVTIQLGTSANDAGLCVLFASATGAMAQQQATCIRNGVLVATSAPIQADLNASGAQATIAAGA